MCEAFLRQWKGGGGKLWITLWGENVIGGEENIGGVF